MKYMKNKSLLTAMARILAISVVTALVLMGTAMGEISKTGLIGEWHFDGDAKDSSGSGNDGTIHGATFVDGKFGKALNFNGLDDYVDAGNKASLNGDFSGLTLSAWAYPKNVSGGSDGVQAIIAKWAYEISGDHLFLGLTNSYITFAVGDGSTNELAVTDGTPPLSKNNWYFIAGTWSKDGTYNIYANGVLVKTGSHNVNKINTQSAITLKIGRQVIEPNRAFNGFIDEVRIYNRALSADEIKANYEAGQITITSSPSGAEVLINSQSKGTASPTLTIIGVSPGSYAVKCKLSGYSDYDINVQLGANRVESINCALNPTPTPTPPPTPFMDTPEVPTPVVPNPGAQPNATTAQTSPTISKSASITGKVLDAKTDDPVQGAIISIDGRSASTDSNGEYELAIDVGKHSLSVNKQGYETVTRSIIVPEVGTMLDLSLKPTSGDSSWLWLVIILIIIVIAAVIIYLLYRRKKKEKVEVKKEEKKVERAVEKKKFCMFCHAPIALDSDYCNKCGKKQDETKRFCMSCGALMPSVPEICGKCKMNPPSGEDTKNCRNCGEVIPVVAKFCSACGAGQPE